MLSIHVGERMKALPTLQHRNPQALHGNSAAMGS